MTTTGHEEDHERWKARVGTTLRGKWKLDALLGVGGMAAVYSATHRIGKRGAIKILHPEVAVSKELRARFEQEAHAVAKLAHPNAIEVLDVDTTEEGAPFMVMELLDGESLGQRAFRLSGIPEMELLGYVATVLDVLHAAHAQGIIHRDIKPDNLFVTGDGRIKVLDFGIARMSGGDIKTRAGMMLGTTSYMAPEQIHGKPIDGRADVYAVGATLFRILAKRRIHEAGSDAELLVKMGTQQAPPLASVAHVDPRTAAVVDRALAFQVDQRYPSASAMRDDVRAILNGKDPAFAAAKATKMDEPTRTDTGSGAVAMAAAAAAMGAGALASGMGSDPTQAPGLIGSDPTLAPGLIGSDPTQAPGLIGSDPTQAPGLMGPMSQGPMSQGPRSGGAPPSGAVPPLATFVSTPAGMDMPASFALDEAVPASTHGGPASGGGAWAVAPGGPHSLVGVSDPTNAAMAAGPHSQSAAQGPAMFVGGYSPAAKTQNESKSPIGMVLVIGGAMLLLGVGITSWVMLGGESSKTSASESRDSEESDEESARSSAKDASASVSGTAGSGAPVASAGPSEVATGRPVITAPPPVTAGTSTTEKPAGTTKPPIIISLPTKPTTTAAPKPTATATSTSPDNSGNGKSGKPPKGKKPKGGDDDDD